MAIRFGTCAWADHSDFYPSVVKPGDRLAHYARFFDLVEIDSSFYAPARPEWVRRWVDSVPENFVFDMKAHKSLTGHVRGGVPDDDLQSVIRLQQEALRILEGSGKCGCFLLQFAPWVKRDEEGMNLVEGSMGRFPGSPLAIEFRHRSWFSAKSQPETLRFLREVGAVHVVADEPQVGEACIPLVPEVTSPALSVMRLHGRNRATWLKPGLASSQDRFDYLYRETELKSLGEVALTLQQAAKDVHMLMNNNRANYAVQNAMDLKRLFSDDPLPPATLF